MTGLTIAQYPHAVPITDTGMEMATCEVRIVIARSGRFRIDGADRTAFVVGSRLTPIPVAYIDRPDCTEVTVAPWLVRPLMDISAAELQGSVHALSDLPASPFLAALTSGSADPRSVADTALANWSAGRGTATARLVSAVWAALQVDPLRPAAAIAADLGVSARRMRRAMRQETGLTTGEVRRLIRHDKVLADLSDPRKPLAQTALDAGYADQSHMTRDLVELGGITPRRLRTALLSPPATGGEVPLHSRPAWH